MIGFPRFSSHQMLMAVMLAEQVGRTSPGRLEFAPNWPPLLRAESIAAVGGLLSDCVEGSAAHLDEVAACKHAGAALFDVFTDPRSVGVLVSRVVDAAITAATIPPAPATYRPTGNDEMANAAARIAQG